MNRESNPSTPRRSAARWFWIAFAIAVAAALVLHGHVKDGASSKSAPDGGTSGAQGRGNP